MATISERLQYILTFDTGSAVRALDKFGQKAKEVTEDPDKRLRRMATGMQIFGATAMATAGIAGKALWSIGSGASDLNESINAVNKTFGDAAEGVIELGESAAEAVGLSRTEFAQLATGFASFAQTIAGEGGDVVGVVEELTQRSADFASVMNMDVNRAVGLFQTSLAGEAEAMRRFGIDVSAATVEQYALANGLAESKSQMTEQIKVAARYGVIMEATESMAGDFSDTSDELANSQRILSAQLKNLKDDIGVGLLPAMKEITNVASILVGGFSELSTEQRKMIGTTAALGTAFLGAAGAASFLIGTALRAKDNFAQVASAFRDMSRAGKTATVALSALGVALTAAAALYVISQRKNQEYEATVRSVSEALTEQVAQLSNTENGLSDLAEAARDATAANDLLADSMVESGVISKEDQAALFKLGLTVDQATDLFLEGRDAVNAFIGSNEELAAQQQEAYASGQLMGEGLEVLNELFNKYEQEVRGGAETTLLAFGASSELNQAVVEQVMQMRDLNVETATGAELAATYAQAVVMAAQAGDVVTDAYTGAGTVLTTFDGRVQDATASMEEAAQTHEEIADGAIAEHGDAVEDLTGDYEEAVDEIGDNLDQARKDAEDWAEGINDSTTRGAESFNDFEASADTSMADFAESMTTSAERMRDWQADLVTIAAEYGPEFAAHLGEMGEAGTELVEEIADSAGSTEADAAFAAWVDNAETLNTDMQAEFDKVAPGLTDKLEDAEEAAVTQMGQAETDFKRAGRDLAESIAEGFANSPAIRYAVQRKINEALAQVNGTSTPPPPQPQYLAGEQYWGRGGAPTTDPGGGFASRGSSTTVNVYGSNLSGDDVVAAVERQRRIDQ